MYGFLQMRGPKEAVNVLLFSGLTLHGRKLTISRPTGFRSEMKNTSEAEYVPDHINGDRMEVLFKAMGGIISGPTGKAYLVAMEGIKIKELKAIDRKADSTYSEDEKPSKDDGGDPKGGKSAGILNSAIGKVIVLIDIAKTFDLQDKSQYEGLLLDVGAECNSFGVVKNVVIPRKGSWVGSAFVEFASTDDARKTVAAMRKRRFESKPIETYVVDTYDTAEEAAKGIRTKSERLTFRDDR